MKCRILVLVSVALLGLTRPAPAQEPAYVDDLRFVQELRQRGDTDLAIDLLDRLAKNASGQLARELPFERALCKKAEAINEPDSGKRLQLYEEARGELLKFRDANPNHPRLGEAKLDIADITLLEGRTMMSRALAQDGLDAQVAGLEKARGKFEGAARELKAVGDELDAQLQKLGEPKTPAERAARAKLQKNRLRAELNQAVNLFDIAQTYHRSHRSDKVLLERAKKMQEAAGAFQKIAGQDDSVSEVWQAKAWAGRCEHELGQPKKARERYVPVIDARNPAAADGARLARYFRLLAIQELLQNGQAEKGESVETLVEGGRRWVRDYPRALNTPEGYGVRYLLAESLLTAAAPDKTPAAQKKEHRDEARKLLEALEQTENEYTDRARRKQIELISLEGGFTKDVSQLRSFRDCYYRAQYESMQIESEAEEIGKVAAELRKSGLKEEERKKLEDDFKAKQAGLEKKRQQHTATALAALERGRQLADPRAKAGNDYKNARALHAFYALGARKYADAIRVGEEFAREDKGPSQAAMAAAYALQAYAQAVAEKERLRKAGKEDELTDDQGRKVDEKTFTRLLEDQRKRMRDFADYCEKSWSKELAGNLARHQIGLMHLRDKELPEAIGKLQGVTPEYPSYLAVRYLIADVCLQADKDGAEPFADAGGKAPVPFRERALAALRTIKEPENADPETNRIYVLAKAKLGEELYRDKKFAEMEALAEPLLKKLPSLTLNDERDTNQKAQEYYRDRLRSVLLYAKYGKADAEFKANEFKKVSDQLQPLLKEVKEDKWPQLKANQPLARGLLLLALRANIHLADLDRVRLVVEVFGKAVGENPDEKVPEALKQMVPLIRTQVRELKAKNDVVALKRTTAGFTTILDDLQKQKKVTPEFLLVLAQCYAAMEQHDRALAILKQIEDLFKAAASPDAELLKTCHAGRIARAQQLRLAAGDDKAKQKENFKEAHKILDEALGTRETPGWGAGAIEAHKERLYLFDKEGRTAEGFNKAQALVKVLDGKVATGGEAAKNHYLECYYYMVYFLYHDGKNSTAAATKEREVAIAAKLILQLEEKFKDFGNEETKNRIAELLKEPLLKAQYEKQKAR